MLKQVLSVVGSVEEAWRLCPVIRAICAEGMGSTVVIFDNGEPISEVCRLFSVLPNRSETLPSGSDIRQAECVFRLLRQVTKDRIPDAVLIFGTQNTSFLTALFAKYRSVPLVYFGEGALDLFGQGSRRKSFFEDGICRMSAMIFANGRSEARKLYRKGIPKSRIFSAERLLQESADIVSKSFSAGQTDQIPVLPKGQKSVCAALTLPKNFREKQKGIGCLVRELGAVHWFCLLPENEKLSELLRIRFGKCANVSLISPADPILAWACLKKSVLMLTDCEAMLAKSRAVGVPALFLKYSMEREKRLETANMRLCPPHRQAIADAGKSVLQTQSDFQPARNLPDLTKEIASFIHSFLRSGTKGRDFSSFDKKFCENL